MKTDISNEHINQTFKNIPLLDQNHNWLWQNVQ